MNLETLSSEFDPLDAPAEEFLSRFRRGEHPALSEFETRYPDLAGRIRVLFPALIEMENVGNRQAEDDLIAAFGRQQSVPAQIGEFRILRKVGEGGMGVVYEAIQESLGRHVALKVLPQEREKKYLERFRREARAAAKLHHTNIVPVFGVGEADGLHFYAMQFIPGQGLDLVLDEVRRLRSTRGLSATVAPSPDQTRTAVAGSVAEALLTGHYAPATASPGTPSSSAVSGSAGSHTELASQPEARYYREIARIGIQVAEALAHAHEQGVLHRDIKPSNLLLDLHGTVWITDFGLAKADDEYNLTRTGDIVGTLRYMAPERFRGNSDVATEVYSLGVTLYELLTLRPVFPETDRVTLIERVCHSAPVRPRKLDHQIPRDLETIVLKAMAREPADRYHSTAAMADDLRRFLADRSITARRASPAEQVRRWARRNKAVAALLGLLFCASVTAAIVFALQGEELRTALKSSEDDRRDLIVSQKEAVRQEREARLRRLDSMIAEARGKTVGRKPGQRFESLARLDEAVSLARELDVFPSRADELRNAFAAALAVPDFHITRSVDGFPNGSLGFDFNADHSVYARTHEDGTCVVARMSDNGEICRVPVPPGPGDGGTWQVLLSGDGQTLLLVRAGGEAHVWRVGEKPQRVFEVPAAQYGDLRSDGRVAAVSHADGSVTILDVLRSMPRVVARMPPTEPPGIVVPFLHPLEPRIAIVRMDPSLAVVRDTETGQVVQRFTGFTPLAAAWHPAGASLAIATVGELRFFDGSTFQPTTTWPIGDFWMMQFNPAGDRLVIAAWNGTLFLFDVATGSKIHAGLPFRDGVRLRWNRTGTHLAGPVDRGRLNIWQVGDGREFRILQRVPSAPTYHLMAMHPNGRLVAASTGSSLAIWEVDTGRVLKNIKIGSPVGQPVFDCEGAMWIPTDHYPASRWPIREDSIRAGEFTIGPAERITIGSGCLARSADAKVWFGIQRARPAFVWRPERPLEQEILPTGSDLGSPNLSPDGRWATTSNHTTHDAKLWDLQQPLKPVMRLYERSGDGIPAFSPDGKWLWVNSDGGQLLHLKTWVPGPKTGRAVGRPAFTADSRIMALETGAGIVRLVETATGRELVRLDNPHQDALHDLAFTPDGSRLVGTAPTGANAPGIHVWELGLIRKQLAERGLDWEAPPLAPRRDSAPVTLTDGVEAACPPAAYEHLRARRWQEGATALTTLPNDPPGRTAALIYRSVAYEKLQQHDKADSDRATLRDAYFNLVDVYKRYATRHSLQREHALALAFSESALRLNPDDATTANNVAWALVTGPPSAQDPKRALPLARHATALAKNKVVFHNTLGCVYYRLGMYDDALDILKMSVKLGTEQSAIADRYLLALCHFKNGDTLPAYTEFLRAVVGDLQWRRRSHPLYQLDLGDLSEEAMFTLFVPGSRRKPVPNSHTRE